MHLFWFVAAAAVLVTLLAVWVIRWWRTVGWPRLRYHRWQKAQASRPLRIHPRSCVVCKEVITNRRMAVNPETLRRTRVYIHDFDFECLPPRWHTWHDEQAELRAQRTDGDWERVTTPLKPELLDAGVMPEQYNGDTRSAIRTFLASGVPVAVVKGVSATTLTQSILALSLTDRLYAETRDGSTVLRLLDVGVSDA